MGNDCIFMLNLHDKRPCKPITIMPQLAYFDAKH